MIWLRFVLASMFLSFLRAFSPHPGVPRWSCQSVVIGSPASSRFLSSDGNGYDGKSDGVHITNANGRQVPADSSQASSLPPVPPKAHRIVLMRHGESEFNNANIFTGWCDVALTPRGVVEAGEAGQVFASHQINFRKCYASLLTRSIVTAHRSLETAGISFTPIEYDWRLNERHYGALQGLSKERTAHRLGRSIVMKWRRSYDARPPLMTPEHPHYDIINDDVRYKDLDGIPLGESLLDCQERVIDAWNHIVSEATASNNDSDYTLLVAHANTLRALVMHLDDIPPDAIEGLNIPTAIPFYYDICKHTRSVVTESRGFNGKASSDDNEQVGNFRGTYMTDERNKRSFLERRRAANDPWLWALHDDQVAPSLLLETDDETEDAVEEREGLAGIEEEAARNTELFSPALGHGDSR